MSIWAVLIIIVFYFIVKYVAALIFWGTAIKLITTNVKKGVDEIVKGGVSNLQGANRPKGAADAHRQRNMQGNGSEKSKETAKAAGR